MDTINIKGMQFYGYHGVFDFEQDEGQPFIVDLALKFDFSEAGLNDNLDATINYAEVFNIVENIVEKMRFHLIEAVTYEICKQLFTTYMQLDGLEVEVKKPSAPIKGDFAYVSAKVNQTRFMFESW